jgi:hypothetical protein
MVLGQILLPGTGTLLAGFLVALALQQVKRIKDQRLRELLTTLVKAAEQIYGPQQGAAKLDYVTQQAAARGAGKVARAAVEAAVFEVSKGR